MKSGIVGLGVGRLLRVVAKVLGAKTLVAARAALARNHEEAEERVPAVFQPEVMLPVQFYELMRRRHELEGEKLLMFAVLEDGIQTYMKHFNSPTRRGQNRFREAAEWIERVDKQWLFSFDNVCEALDIDPEYMRRGLRRWASMQRDKAGGQHAAPG